VTGPAESLTQLAIGRAKSALHSAEILTEAGEYADAVSRAYYAVFHAASALLATIGRSARTHDGLRTLVSEHFVRPGVLAPAQARVLARMAADRNDAEYNVAAVFGEADAQHDVDEARAFLAAVEALLKVPPGEDAGA